MRTLVRLILEFLCKAFVVVLRSAELMKRAANCFAFLLMLWLGLAAFAQNHRGLLVVFDSAQTSQSVRHKLLVELLRQKRAEGHFAATGLEQYFQIYDFGEAQMAASLKRMGIARNGTYLCLTQLDGKDRPVKVSWRIAYRSAPDALTALDSQLGLSSNVVDPSPTPSPASTQSPERLLMGNDLSAGAMLESPNQRYRLAVQTDGNCVFYRVDGSNLVPIWGTETHGGSVRLSLDGRGCLRVLSARGEALWSSPEQPAGEYQLQVQDDGNLVIYRRQGNNGIPVWSPLL